MGIQWIFMLSSRQCHCVHKCNTVGLSSFCIAPLSVPKVEVGKRVAVPIVQVGKRAAVPIVELGEQRLRLRSCLFCEGRISVLKRWFKTPIQNAVHGSTVYASLEKKTISWACTAHCSRLLFELKWTGKAFIWRHLNVVICDFAFMLPPESAFCSNHDRKRTFLGVLNQRFETTFIRK